MSLPEAPRDSHLGQYFIIRGGKPPDPEENARLAGAKTMENEAIAQVNLPKLRESLYEIVDPFAQYLANTAFWRNKAGLDRVDDTEHVPKPRDRKLIKTLKELRRRLPHDPTKRITDWTEQDGDKTYDYTLRFDKTEDGIMVKNFRFVITAPDQHEGYSPLKKRTAAEVKVELDHNKISSVSFGWHYVPQSNTYLQELAATNPSLGALFEKCDRLSYTHDRNRNLPPEAIARFVIDENPQLVLESAYLKGGGYLWRRPRNDKPPRPYFIYTYRPVHNQFRESSEEVIRKEEDKVVEVEEYKEHLGDILQIVPIQDVAA